MKRIVRTALIGLLMAIVIGAAGAQSLAENEYYKKSVELKAAAAKAYDEGDYDAAAKYAQEAQENARLSDEYVDKILSQRAADKSIQAAKDRIAWADSVGAKNTYPDEYSKAQDEMNAANTSYSAEQYKDAKDHADAVVAALANVSETLPFPQYYTVRLIPEKRDCLWNIAGYPFIYNNPTKWAKIYEANKKTFRDPSNPNLIFPGQVLVIPSLKGEERSGTYDPSKTYPALPRK